MRWSPPSFLIAPGLSPLCLLEEIYYLTKNLLVYWTEVLRIYLQRALELMEQASEKVSEAALLL